MWSRYYEDKKQLKTLNLQEKFELLTLVRFYDSSLNFITTIAKEYKNGVEFMDISSFIANYNSLNKDFNFTDEDNLKIWKNHFIVNNENMINLESFFNFFSRKFSIKINVDDYLNISLKGFTLLFGTIESKLKNFFNMYAVKGMIYYTQFDIIFKNIFEKSENKWKTLEYFR